ncbi:collagen alpha-5(vi) chain [Plakobranchus ocellatus]|uniref:Collagen alpha-5(Vi) chain n=1 Tax=Plakobranchus ocellatus TaxID=259542 RepID=A0AAV4BL40_9GAST|nr:collagen alpha-5(vi) chain [Plakobranchus ocellatus]
MQTCSDFARCPDYTNVPLGCTRVPDPKDPACCKIPDCGTATATGGGTTGGTNPVGFAGTVTGYGRPADPNSITGYRNGCLYKGVAHNQGSTWQDGCDFDCECVDATTGKYVCTERCQRFGSLPSSCSLVPDQTDRCCTKVECNPVAPPVVTSAPSGTGACADKLQDCYLYGQSACTDAQYSAWARENCASFCGFCGTTQSGVCADKLPNCQDYSSDSCVGSYTSWAQFNCAKTCGYCSGSGGVGVTQTSFTGSGTATCVDKLPDCAQYDDASCRAPYEQWALDNCPLRCNLCNQLLAGGASGGGITGNNLGLFTIDPNLQVITGSSGGVCYYNGKTYQQGATWQDGCQYNCTCENAQTGFYKCIERCPTYPVLPNGCSLQTRPGKCCREPACVGADGSITWGISQSSGCLYKGQVYLQGAKWDDGCDYKCTCVDGSTGQHQCTNKCYTWNLPPICSLDPPAAGKCCQTPNCPSNVQIQYPPNYVAE